MHPATIKEDIRSGITCLWTIENFSYFLYEKKFLKTPPFHNRLMMDLILYPYGEHNSKYISLYLRMPTNYQLKCDVELSLIASDGSSVQKYVRKSFTSGGEYSTIHGKSAFIAREEIFNNRNAYLPQDSLTVCCRLHCGEAYSATLGLYGKYLTRSRIVLDKRTFPWHIPMLNSYREFEENTVHLGNSIYDLKFFFEVGTVAETKVKLEIRPRNLSNCFLTCKIDILDSQETVRVSFKGEHRHNNESGDAIWNFPILITKNELLKGNYLKDDKLSLRCQLAASFGTISIEFDDEILAFPSSSEIPKASGDNAISKEFRSLTDDIFGAFKDQKFIDATVRTIDKTFFAHRIVLSARSPVFSAMLAEAAFEEGKTGVMEISDVDGDTMELLLKFIYTDTVGDIGWEEASNLYSAADKYDIQGLRQKCASVLESKLSVLNVCEVLLLTELHQEESDLRRIVQDFILAHDEEILRSEEWAILLESHPQVTAKALCQVYLQKLRNA